MKVKIRKSDYSVITPGMIGEAQPMKADPKNWFEVTFDNISNPVPGYTTAGEFTGAFQKEQLEFLEDDKLIQEEPDAKRIENLIQVMRTCKLNQIREQLEFELKEFPESFGDFEKFYISASTR